MRDTIVSAAFFLLCAVGIASMTYTRASEMKSLPAPACCGAACTCGDDCKCCGCCCQHKK